MAIATLFDAVRSDFYNDLSAQTNLALAKSSMILGVLPFKGTATLQFDEHFSKESNEAEFRAINGSFTNTDFDMDKLQYSVAPLGSDIQVDKILMKTHPRTMAIQFSEKAFGIAAKYNDTFFNGNQAVNTKEFNGLKSIMEIQLDGSQTLHATPLNDGTPTAGGDALSLATVDEAIDAVRNPNVMFMSADLARKFTQAARGDVGGQIIWGLDQFGNRIATYNGLRIVVVKGAFNADNVMPYDEPATDDETLTTTSLYIARMGEDGLYGAQLGPVEANNFGLVQATTYHAGVVDWVAGVGLAHPLACVRIDNILKAAVTV